MSRMLNVTAQVYDVYMLVLLEFACASSEASASTNDE